MKYLITDPCYLIGNNGLHSDWEKFLDVTNFGDSLPDGGYNVDGIGKIVSVSGTDNGDGSLLVKDKNGKTWDKGVDAGMVCLVEVADDFDVDKVCKDFGFALTLGAVTDDKDVADDWYYRASRI